MRNLVVQFFDIKQRPYAYIEKNFEMNAYGLWGSDLFKRILWFYITAWSAGAGNSGRILQSAGRFFV